MLYKPGFSNPSDDISPQLLSIDLSHSEEKGLKALLEEILASAQIATNAEAATMYLMEGRNQLRFEISRNSVKDDSGKNSLTPLNASFVNLFNADGEANLDTVVSYAANTGASVNIPDRDTATGFDFSGSRAYDKLINYRSVSFLTIPLLDHQSELIGVLQLINRKDRRAGCISHFTKHDQSIAESLASQAALLLTKHKLVDQLKDLLEKFIEVIASAIDEKSPHTGGHCRRVPDIAMLIAESVNEAKAGPHQHTVLSESELYELKIAALLHDCGKISSPIHIADKATKLEKIVNRIELVEMRFQLYLMHLKQLVLLALMQNPTNLEKAEELRACQQKKIALLLEDLEFIKRINIGGEFMIDEDLQRLHKISNIEWTDEEGIAHKLLTEDEVKHLSVTKGTLTEEEKLELDNHIVLTQKMLTSLPFPPNLKNVPEIAGNHHERMDGKGYPKGLQGHEMSLQARIMCIADIFEALTASDRPYKTPFPISKALNILGNMAKTGHIDPKLFDVFVRQKVYEKYGKRFDYLQAEQMDKVDIDSIPGYSARPPS